MKFLYCILCILCSQYGFSQQVDPKQTSKEPVNPYAEKPLLVNQFLYFDSEYILIDFESFEPHFHSKNIDLLEKSKLLWGIEYGVQYKALFFGANINFGSQKGTVTDSIDSKVNYTRFGLSLGYYILNTKLIQIVPRTSIYLNNISLKNFNSKDDIPLDDYTTNPDFKLRFSQFTSQLGIDINIKIPKLSTKPGQPFLLGFKTAYNVDIGSTSLSSDENTLKSGSNLKSIPLTLGIHFTILL